MPLSDFISQPLVTSLFQRSLENSRMHHAYLLIGESSETEPMALAFAQALNCENQKADFCGQCETCKAIAKNQYPDFHIIRPESKSRRIVIEQVRSLERAIYLKASRARTKVAMIYGADRLQLEAQDAFLKTLEEPPPQTIFLLLSEEPQQLKETILSRCLRIPFRPVKKSEKTFQQQQVESWLAEFVIPQAEGSSIFRAYGFVGKTLEMLKDLRETKLKEVEELLSDRIYENLEHLQRERLEEQMAAQAQAEYLRERSLVLKTIVEWHYNRYACPHAVEIIENLARRLGRNVHESLAWEIAMIQLAEIKEK